MGKFTKHFLWSHRIPLPSLIFQHLSIIFLLGPSFQPGLSHTGHSSFFILCVSLIWLVSKPIKKLGRKCGSKNPNLDKLVTLITHIKGEYSAIVGFFVRDVVVVENRLHHLRGERETVGQCGDCHFVYLVIWVVKCCVVVRHFHFIGFYMVKSSFILQKPISLQD